MADDALGKLQHDLNEAEMSITIYETAMKKFKGSKRKQLEEQRDEVKHKHDILGLQIEVRETELNTEMKEEDKKQHIEKLKQEIAKGELAEAERKARLNKPAQTKAAGSRQRQPGEPAVVDEQP